MEKYKNTPKNDTRKKNFTSLSSHRSIGVLATSSLHMIHKLEKVLVLWSE
jgi:hypothetical protein